MFSNPKKIVDRWVGSEPVRLHGGAIEVLSYTFRVAGDALTEAQIETATRILDRYNSIWEVISKKFPWNNFSNRLLLYIPAVIGKEEFDYMLGYERNENGKLLCSFFAFNGDELVHEFIDIH